MSKTKKKLRRALRECRRALDELTRDDRDLTAAGGLCAPVPSWRDDVAGELGIRYATPPDPRIAKLEAELAGHRETIVRREARLVEAERELREAERHLKHHHERGPFTLVREVTPQVEAMNTRLRAEARERDDRIVELAAEVSRLRETWEPPEDDDGTRPELPDDEPVVTLPVKQCGIRIAHYPHSWGTIQHEAWCEGLDEVQVVPDAPGADPSVPVRECHAGTPHAGHFWEARIGGVGVSVKTWCPGW